jgi:hypothetical protein
MRFDMDADTWEGVCRYFHRRAIQGLMDGHRWTGAVEPLTVPAPSGDVAWGARTTSMGPDGVTYQSVYVYASHRGQGHLSRYVAATDLPFVTGPDCDLERFFQSRGVRYVVAGRFTLEKEYRAISAHYDDRCARRSGVPLMNHIDEGLAVLRAINASERAMRAFTIHPLVQLDEELPRSYERLGELTDDPRVLVLAMEYRNIANAYLSGREVASLDEIGLGPLPEVHAMLVADKVQNRKDFARYHRGTHPRSDALDRYFDNWLRRLGITEDRYDALAARLQCPPSPVGGCSTSAI